MSLKRKRVGEDTLAGNGKVSSASKSGAATYKTGRDVKNAIELFTKASLVAVEKQIRVPNSAQPVSITHENVVLVQHYLALDPAFDGILRAWRFGNDNKNTDVTESSVELLTTMIRLLSSVPYFQTTLATLVERVVSTSEPYLGLLNRLIQSSKRESTLAGIGLAAACANVDSSGSSTGTVSRLTSKVWAGLMEGTTPKVLPKLLSMRRKGGFGKGADPLDRPDIRHLTISLLLPLLPHAPFLSLSKPILPPLFTNMKDDPPVTILRILTGLWNSLNASASPAINRKVALALIDETAIESLMKIYSRVEDAERIQDVTPAEMVHHFLISICTKPGAGICFPDQGWYRREVKNAGQGHDDEPEAAAVRGARRGEAEGGIHNRILGNVVRRVGPKIAEDSHMAAWTEAVLGSCPELVVGYWPHSAISLDPRLSAKWIATISFVGRVISLPIPTMESFRSPVDPTSFRPTPPSLQAVIESALPSPLTKVNLTKGLQSSKGIVQHLTALTLSRALQKLVSIQTLFREIIAKSITPEEGNVDVDAPENPWVKRLRDIEYEARKRVPEVLVIIGFAQKAAASQALQASAEDTDVGAKAQAELLTESALRLFGLYHSALPTLAAEVRFDVGKLLVSSSGAKGEAEARRAMREGSVLSDAGSVASIGTVGSIGMGGGFGQARGDVEEFDALSQIHVLELLSQVGQWQWNNKAAGSQYTYLYHLLQLYLTTDHQATRLTTEKLLQSILGDSVLFEHNPLELGAWLECLPVVPHGLKEDSLVSVTERMHLLAFLDDCVRRCMKTPYRYLEEAQALTVAPEVVTSRSLAASPLIMTLLEQLKAKLVGHHISAEAGLVVIRYIRQLILSIAGMQPTLDLASALAKQLLECVSDAEEKRATTLPELRRAAQLATSQLTVLRNPSLNAFATFTFDEAAESMALLRGLLDLDPAEHCLWAAAGVQDGSLEHLSLDWRLVHTPLTGDLSDKACADLTHSLTNCQSQSGLVRFTQLILHRLSGLKIRKAAAVLDPVKRCLSLISTCAARLDGYSNGADQLKQVYYEDPSVQTLYSSAVWIEQLPELSALVAKLDSALASDKALVEPYVKISQDLVMSQKAKDLPNVAAVAKIWVPFFDPAVAGSCLDSMTGKVSSDSTGPAGQALIRALIQQADSADVIMSHLSFVVNLGLLETASQILGKHVPAGIQRNVAPVSSTAMEARWTEASTSRSAVASDIVDTLLVHDDPHAIELLSVLVTRSSTVIEPILATLATFSWTQESARRMSPLLEALLSGYNGSLPQADAVASKILLSALDDSIPSSEAAQCLRVLVLLCQGSEATRQSIGQVLHTQFSVPTAVPSRTSIAAMQRLISLDSSTFGPSLEPATSASLRWAVRVLSSVNPLSDAEIGTIKVTAELFSLTEKGQVSAYLAEPVLTAIVLDRLGDDCALTLAAIIVDKAEFKAAAIRQHLSLLFANKQYPRFAALPLEDPLRTRLTALLHALFFASPYVSCQPNFIEPLLRLYQASKLQADLDILAILRLFEQHRKISVASMLRGWMPGNIPITGNSQRYFDILMALDANTMFSTCIQYDMRRSPSKPVTALTEQTSNPVYDEVFVLPLIAVTLREGNMTGLDWVEMLRSNAIGLAVCALSSRSPEMRNMAAYILAKAIHAVKATPFQERPATHRLLRLLRHSLPASVEIEGEPGSTPRLPCMITLFFAHALRAIAEPSSFLYPLTSRFLLQRPTVDTRDVPMLYGMLYAAGEGSKKERRWMVRFIRDAARSRDDWHILQRRHTFALLTSLYGSSVDAGLRRLIVQAIASMTRIPAAAQHLVKRQGLLEWLAMNLPTSASEIATFVEILDNVAVNGLGGSQMLVLVEKFSVHADLSTLRKLSEILLLVSPCSPTSLLTPLRCLTTLLRTLDHPLDHPSTDANWCATVESLFRAGLAWDPLGHEDDGEAKEVMAWLGCRGVGLEGGVGEWARGEWRRV